MPAPLHPIEELDRRHVAAWDTYLSDHAPGKTRRQVFTGGAEGVTDRRREYHVEMATLDKAVFATRRTLRQAREARQNWSEEEVHHRALLKKTTKTMERRNIFFEKYTRVIKPPPSGKHTANATGQDVIDSRPSWLRSEGGNGTGPDPNRAIDSLLSSRPSTKPIESHLSSGTKPIESHLSSGTKAIESHLSSGPPTKASESHLSSRSSTTASGEWLTSFASLLPSG
jgi:hypothetical protein